MKFCAGPPNFISMAPFGVVHEKIKCHRSGSVSIQRFNSLENTQRTERDYVDVGPLLFFRNLPIL